MSDSKDADRSGSGDDDTDDDFFPPPDIIDQNISWILEASRVADNAPSFHTSDSDPSADVVGLSPNEASAPGKGLGLATSLPGTDDLLAVLRLVAQHDIRIFHLGSAFRQKVWRMLGGGSGAVVQQARLPLHHELYPDYRRLERFHGESQDSAVMTDDLGISWKADAMVAYKMSRLTSASAAPAQKRIRHLVRGLLKDLRVLYTRGLRNHPNIVLSLGTTLVPFEDLPGGGEEAGDAPTLYWPIVILEKARDLSLKGLLASDAFVGRGSPITLFNKWRLCIDVLRGLKALHAHGVLHGDVKAANTIVFRTEEGTAFNWRAKVCDFDASHLDVSARSGPVSGRSRLIGTRMNAAPELFTSRDFAWEQTFKQDIWSWGMMLWSVMLNGAPLVDADPEDVAASIMHHRDLGQLMHVARESCRKGLRVYGPQDEVLTKLLDRTLGQCLDMAPERRPSAAELLDSVTKDLRAQFPAFVDVGVLQLGDPGAAVQHRQKPLLDIPDIYYDLLPIPGLSRQVVEGLRTLAIGNNDLLDDPDRRTSLAAGYQLALCLAAGFGEEADHVKALQLLVDVALQGYTDAQVMLLPVRAALRVDPASSQGDGSKDCSVAMPTSDKIRAWLVRAARTGSLLALKHLEQHFGGSASVEAALGLASESLQGQEPEKDAQRALYWASRLANTEDIERALVSGADVLASLDYYGTTALHLAALRHDTDAVGAIRLLVSKGADINVRSRALPSRDGGADLFRTPDHLREPSTPLEWAVLDDNVEVVRELLDADRYDAPPSLRNVVRSACMGLSVHALEYLLALPAFDDSHREGLGFSDRNSCTLLYWTLRPNVFDQMSAQGSRTKDGSLVERLVSATRQVTSKEEPSSAWAVNDRGLFSALHLLASFAQPEHLSALLETFPGLCEEINARSAPGFTPLRDALIRGRRLAFKTLLDHGADLGEVHEGHIHAAHLCSYGPEDPTALEMAAAIVQADPDAASRRDFLGRTPLHFAALTGSPALIRFWLAHGGNLLAYDRERYTPLGRAVVNRTVEGVRTLRDAHLARGIPLLAARPTWIPDYAAWGEDTVTALGTLLSTGRFSPAETRDALPVPAIQPGCYDLGWSEGSASILGLLLERPHFRGGLVSQGPVYFLLRSDSALSGLGNAVRYGNLEVVGAVVYARHLADLDFRGLVQAALDQLRSGTEHPAGFEQRTIMVQMLESKEVEEFGKTRTERLGSRLWGVRFLWAAYYRWYADPEQALYLTYVDWQRRNPFLYFEPFFPAYGDWPRLRFSYCLANLVSTWPPLVTIVACSARLDENPASWGLESIGQRMTRQSALLFLCIATELLSQWPRVLRLGSLATDLALFGRRPRPKYTWKTLVSLLSCGAGGLVLALACVLNLLALWRASETSTALRSSGHSSAALAVIWSAAALVVWIVAGVLLPLVIFIFLPTLDAVGKLRREHSLTLVDMTRRRPDCVRPDLNYVWFRFRTARHG